MRRSTDTLGRLLDLLRLIPRGPRSMTTTEITERLTVLGHKVDVRTVQRDLATLELKFPLQCRAEGRTNHWYWDRRQPPLEIPKLTGSAAIALLLVRDYLSPLLPTAVFDELSPYFLNAQETLKGTKLQRWRERVRMIGRGTMLRAPDIEPAVRDAVYQALLEGRQLEADYRSAGSTELRKFTINPVALVAKDEVLYLVATLWDYEDPRQLALHRMTRPKLLDQPAKLPHVFDLQSYIEEDKEFAYPVSPEKIKLVALLDEWVATHVRERSLSGDQQLEPHDNERVLLRATVSDTNELRWWLLSFGDQVEVLKPDRLRRDFKATARRLAAMYDSV